MSINVLILIILIYLFLCFVLYQIGKGKKMGGVAIGIVSLFFTPVVGFILFFFAQNRMVAMETRYQCPECKFEFTQQHKHCPHCDDKEREVMLIEVQRNMV